MRSTVHALLWEQWRRLRWPMLFALLFMAAVSLFDYVRAGAPLYLPPSGALSLAVIILCMGLFLAFLIFSHAEASDLHLTLPGRLYTLPVKTDVLVNCQFFFRLAAVGLLSLAMLSTHYLLFEDWYFDDFSLLWKVPLFLMGSLAFIQAVFWWPRGPWILGGVILVGVLVARAWWLVARQFGEVPELPAGDKLKLLMLIAALGYLLALVGVRLDRCGAWPDIKTRMAAMLRLGAARYDRFCSSAHAQAWFEWNRKGKYVPIVATSCLALTLVIPGLAITLVIPGLLGLLVPHPAHLYDEYIRQMAALALGLYPLIAAFVVGALIPALDHRDMGSGFSSFVMTRPISTKQLAAARLKMGAFSVGLTYILTVVILIARFGLAAFLNTLAFLSRETLPLGIPRMAFVLVACCHVALAWTLLWLSLPLAGLLLIVVILSWLDAVALHSMFGAGSFLWMPTVVLLLAIAALASLAYRRRILTASTLPTVLLVCIISVIVVLTTVSLLGWPVFKDDPESHTATAFSVALSLLPVAAFLWEPLKLDWFRHR